MGEVCAESQAIAAASASREACAEADRLENDAATSRASHAATVASPHLMASSEEADKLDKEAAAAGEEAAAARSQGRAGAQAGDIRQAQARRAKAEAADAPLRTRHCRSALPPFSSSGLRQRRNELEAEALRARRPPRKGPFY